MFGWRQRESAPAQTMLTRALGRLITGDTKRPTTRSPLRQHNPDAVIDCGVYVTGSRRTAAVHYADAAHQAKARQGAFVWLGLHEPDPVTMRSVAETFDLHDLIVEQTVTSGHRPAAETIGTVTRLVLRTARYVEHEALTETSEVVDTGDITVLVGPWFVITVRQGAAGALSCVRRDLAERPQLLRHGPWAVAHAVASHLVDEYLAVAAAVERDLERIEEETFAAPRSSEIAHFYQLKREMVEFKRAVRPLQEPLGRLLDAGTPPAVLRPYFFDVRDRLARAVERVAGFDDLLNSVLQARLAQVSVQQNDDMRRIAAWAAIAAVPTVISGLYGTNFAVLPGRDAPYAYDVTIGLIAALCGLLYWRFKKAGWL